MIYSPQNIKQLVAIDFQFDEAQDFNQGVAKVKQDGSWKYIDKSGKVITSVPASISNRDSQKSNRSTRYQAKLYPVENSKYGFKNIKGELVIPYQFDYVDNFHEGLAIVKQNGKYGFINTSGDLVIPCQFDYVDNFHEGLSRVKQNEDTLGKKKRD